MKFPRNARIFRGQLDAAPFANVFFLLVIFLMLAALVYTPGVPLQLPTADNLPGPDKPTIAVAVDRNGRTFYQNQVIEERQLREHLRQAAKATGGPPTLLLQIDKDASWETLLRLSLMAREVGITQAWPAALPRALAPER